MDMGWLGKIFAMIFQGFSDLTKPNGVLTGFAKNLQSFQRSVNPNYPLSSDELTTPHHKLVMELLQGLDKDTQIKFTHDIRKAEENTDPHQRAAATQKLIADAALQLLNSTKSHEQELGGSILQRLTKKTLSALNTRESEVLSAMVGEESAYLESLALQTIEEGLTAEKTSAELLNTLEIHPEFMAISSLSPSDPKRLAVDRILTAARQAVRQGASSLQLCEAVVDQAGSGGVSIYLGKKTHQMNHAVPPLTCKQKMEAFIGGEGQGVDPILDRVRNNPSHPFHASGRDVHHTLSSALSEGGADTALLIDVMERHTRAVLPFLQSRDLLKEFRTHAEQDALYGIPASQHREHPFSAKIMNRLAKLEKQYSEYEEANQSYQNLQKSTSVCAATKEKARQLRDQKWQDWVGQQRKLNLKQIKRSETEAAEETAVLLKNVKSERAHRFVSIYNEAFLQIRNLNHHLHALNTERTHLMPTGSGGTYTPEQITKRAELQLKMDELVALKQEILLSIKTLGDHISDVDSEGRVLQSNRNLKTAFRLFANPHDSSLPPPRRTGVVAGSPEHVAEMFTYSGPTPPVLESDRIQYAMAQAVQMTAQLPHATAEQILKAALNAAGELDFMGEIRYRELKRAADKLSDMGSYYDASMKRLKLVNQ